MSTTPEQTRTDDHIVHTISRWLARHISDQELRAELDSVELGELTQDQADAVTELRDELGNGTGRASVEMVARETVEALALGG
jgi:hypothetical protein